VFAELTRIRREKIPEIARAPRPAASAPAPAQADTRAQASDALASRAAPAPSARANAFARESERLGTGHGAREYAHVDTTNFERATRQPVETDAIWYDSYANLVAQGIIQRPVAHGAPTPFPGGFVPDPGVR
jgi:hypothetical protein